MATRAWDLLDRRILAGLAFVDALGRPVACPISVRGPDGFRFFLKRPGMLVVTDAPGLAAHTSVFEAAPGTPAVRSVHVQLDIKPADPAYGARRFDLRLPRHPDRANANAVFTPVEIVLPPTPLARADGLAAGLRVAVTRSDDNRAIEGALVRLRPAGGRPQTVALTDAAGEALLLADGIPFATPAPGPVMLDDFAAELDAVVDPALAGFHAPDEVFAARAAAETRTTDFIDPDTLAGTATAVTNLRIAAGRIRAATLSWTPP